MMTHAPSDVTIRSCPIVYILHDIQSGAHFKTPSQMSQVTNDSLNLWWIEFVKQQRQMHSKLVKSFHKQKRWITRHIWNAINTRTSLETKTIRKHQLTMCEAHQQKQIGQKEGNGTIMPGGQSQKCMARSMSCGRLLPNVSLATELNNFYASSEAISRQQAKTAEPEVKGQVGAPFTPITFSEHGVRRIFKHVKLNKAEGAGGISGQLLKLCADQLPQVFTIIFNLSLAQLATTLQWI